MVRGRSTRERYVFAPPRATILLRPLHIHRVYNPALVDNNTVYAFTRKEGYFYGVMPIREELKTRDNPQAAGEWKIGILGKERVGFGVLDNLGLIQCNFTNN